MERGILFRHDPIARAQPSNLQERRTNKQGNTLRRGLLRIALGDEANTRPPKVVTPNNSLLV